MADPPSDRPPPMTELDPISAVRCTRCGGSVEMRKPVLPRNPFLPRSPLRVVCRDCGLDFDVLPVEGPPSGDPPWG